jgi:hypothetical protein
MTAAKRVRRKPLRQPVLAGLDCQYGHHSVLVDGEPRRLLDCIHVDKVCLHCGLVVGHTSWSARGWQQHLKQQAKKRSAPS